MILNNLSQPDELLLIEGFVGYLGKLMVIFKEYYPRSFLTIWHLVDCNTGLRYGYAKQYENRRLLYLTDLCLKVEPEDSGYSGDYIHSIINKYVDRLKETSTFGFFYKRTKDLKLQIPEYITLKLQKKFFFPGDLLLVRETTDSFFINSNNILKVTEDSIGFFNSLSDFFKKVKVEDYILVKVSDALTNFYKKTSPNDLKDSLTKLIDALQTSLKVYEL